MFNYDTIPKLKKYSTYWASFTKVRRKIGCMVVSLQNVQFINMDMSGGYDQISRQVWAPEHMFLSPSVCCTLVVVEESPPTWL